MVDILHICCSTDDNYVQHCAVMLCSLFENNNKLHFEVHILISKLSSENIDRLNNLVSKYDNICSFHRVDSSLLKGAQYRIKRPLTEAAYYRVLLSSILDSSINKVLYLDCDLLVLEDISEIFKLEIDDYPLAAVQEPVEITDKHRNQLSIPYGESYFNSGVLLINLEYWRNNDSQVKLIEFSKRKRFVYCHDQDALNYVFKKKWYRLPPKWNKSNIATLDNIDFYNLIDKREYVKNPIIVHFIDEPKPWQGIYGMRNRKGYYKYLKLAQWKDIAPKCNFSKSLIMYKRLVVYYTKTLLYKLGLLRIIKELKIVTLGKFG